MDRAGLRGAAADPRARGLPTQEHPHPGRGIPAGRARPGLGDGRLGQPGGRSGAARRRRGVQPRRSRSLYGGSLRGVAGRGRGGDPETLDRRSRDAPPGGHGLGGREPPLRGPAHALGPRGVASLPQPLADARARVGAGVARMITGLEQVLSETAEPGLCELRDALGRVLGGSGNAVLAGSQRLKSRVFRLRFTTGAVTRAVVVKRMDPLAARRSEMVAWRWLPAVDLGAAGPGLLGTAPAGRGEWVWHVYEDHGENALQGREADAARVAAAAGMLARIHSRFASHPLLAECRQLGAFDISWYSANLRDASRALQTLRAPALALTADQEALRERLLARIARLLDEEPWRAQAIAESGGPETLLHGDPWTSNVFVLHSPEGFEARFTDWDRAGVGPISYDLSTFLLRFPAARRGWILDVYLKSLEGPAWRPPAVSRLNLLFETAELSRYANRVIWPALAIARERAAWGFAELAEVERWFEALAPVLPPARTGPETVVP